MPTLYVVAGKIYDTDGTTAMSNIAVRARNETTGESSQTQYTSTAGEFAFNLADSVDFPSGWTVGDVITVFVLYNQYEGSVSHTTTTGSGGVTNLSITLAVVTVSSLRYFTVGNFYRYFNLTTTDIPTQHIVTIGKGVEAQIDGELGQRFDGSNAVTLEYHDSNGIGAGNRDFFSKFKPIQTITSLKVSLDDEDVAGTSYTTLTEATHYICDKITGRFSIIDDDYLPTNRRAGVQMNYTYGYSSVPEDVKRLAILMTGSFMMKSSVIKANTSGRDNFSPSVLNALDAEINLIKIRYRHFRMTVV